jgi:hypothetical protein
VHLHAAFIPPAENLDALTSLVRALEPPPQAAAPPVERRSVFARRTPEPPPAVEPAGPVLDLLGLDQMWVPITDFGFVRTGVARQLVDAVTRAAQRYEPPHVSLAGGSALIDEDDRHVWVELQGVDDGIEAMRGIAREVVAVVEPLGFYCDRRQFRSRIPLATINDRTTVEHLEVVLAALDAHHEPWVVGEFALLQRHMGVWQTVPIGS